MTLQINSFYYRVIKSSSYEIIFNYKLIYLRVNVAFRYVNEMKIKELKILNEDKILN